MDVESVEERVNISDKRETIDYSHGMPAAGRNWAGQGGGDLDPPTIQSVDYNHGQGGGGGGPPGDYRGSGGYPAAPLPHPMAGAYGGYATYAGFEGFAGGSGMPGMQSSGYFPSGVDAATLFAAYNEQTGQFPQVSFHSSNNSATTIVDLTCNY